jgi:hypothetical protein
MSEARQNSNGIARKLDNQDDSAQRSEIRSASNLRFPMQAPWLDPRPGNIASGGIETRQNLHGIGPHLTIDHDHR